MVAEPDLSRPSTGHDILAVICAVIATPLLIPTFFLQFCLTPEGVWNQTSMWDGFHRYRWADVETLAIGCDDTSSTKSRPTWFAYPEIWMKDGVKIPLSQLMGDSGLSDYAPVVRALHGRDFKFDTSGVVKGCNAHVLPMLMRRP